MEIAQEDDLFSPKRQFVHRSVLKEQVETFQELVFNH
jgi:hypothetical protein